MRLSEHYPCGTLARARAGSSTNAVKEDRCDRCGVSGIGMQLYGSRGHLRSPNSAYLLMESPVVCYHDTRAMTITPPTIDHGLIAIRMQQLFAVHSETGYQYDRSHLLHVSIAACLSPQLQHFFFPPPFALLPSTFVDLPDPLVAADVEDR
jgi:hypothetical protein